MSELRRPVALAILVLLCAQFLVLGLVQASRDAVAVDEAVDLQGGLVAVQRHDLRMVPEHALVLPALSAILPSLLADPILPETPAFEDGDWFDYTDDVTRANDEAGRLEEVVFWFRVVPLLLGMFTGVLLSVLGSRLVNRTGGLIAAGLWLTTPYIVGLAHLSSLDVAFSFAVVLLALMMDRWRESCSDGRTVALAAALGFCLLTRHTALVLVPVVVVSVLLVARYQDRRTRFRQVAAVLVLPLVVVWVAYRVVAPMPVDGPPRERFDALIDVAAAEGPAQSLALAVPMPIEWRAGLAYLIETSEPRPAYLLGESWSGSRPGYFPVSTAVKFPVPALAALVGGLLCWRLASRDERRRAALVVGAPALVLSSFLVLQPLNIGLRLAVPVIALAFVGCASLARMDRRWSWVLGALLLIGQIAAVSSAHPTSLAWTPPPFSDGYRAVSDGSIDLGQANRSVRDRHAERPFVAATLTAPRGYEVLDGVPTVESSDADDLVGEVAVSATELTVRHRDDLSWLRAYCPVEVIDDAVLVYRFDERVDVAPGPDTPASPCDGDVSRRR